MFKCQYCNREFTTDKGKNFHERYCKQNPNKDTINVIGKIKYGVFKCKFCNKEFTTLRGLNFHKNACERNPNKSYTVWNKSKTKFTDKRVQQYGLTMRKHYKEGLIIPWNTGNHLPDDVKLKISNSRKRYIELHPKNSTWINKKNSYPERYFKYIFIKENIDLKHHKQIGRYELDFYNDDKMKYIEIDGEQHYTESGINHDTKRTKFLLDLGWVGIRIRWSQYCKLSLKERKEYILYIKNFLK